MTHQDYVGKAWYALRRTLPPWSWEQNLRELVELCPGYRIDEVIIKVDTEEFSHHILPIVWLEEYQKTLFAIKEALAQVGIVFSINPWVTLVHGDRARNCKKQFPHINFMVGHDGSQCNDCACPLSEGWRRHTQELWRLYAQTCPDTIWVEDDIRTFNHLPVEYGCFCDAHVQQFARRIGKDVTREQIVQGVLRPGSPHPYRKEWLGMQGDIMVDVARLLSETVHEVSPQTKLGLMSSEPPAHAAEGRKWHEFTRALADGTDVISRPGNGSYTEMHLTDLYFTANSIRLTRHARSCPAIELVEVENFPYSQYAKSARFTFLQAAVSVAMGCQGMAFNLFDHGGSPMMEDAATLNLLRDEKPYLQALARKTDPSGVFAGIGTLHRNDASLFKHLAQGADYADLVPDDDRWDDQLQALGFATTCASSPVVALSGQAVRCLSQEQVLGLLSQGILCDLMAAIALQEMGYVAYLGVEVLETFRRDQLPVAAEHLYHEDYGGRDRQYAALTIHPGDMELANRKAHPGAVEISEIVDFETRRMYPGVTLFENSLGGRVAVYPFTLKHMTYRRFLSPLRHRQLHHVLEWVSRSRIPLRVAGGHNALPLRLDMPSHSVVAAFCLSLDPWHHVSLHLTTRDRAVRGVRVLESTGEWHVFKAFEQRGDSLHITYSREVTMHRPLVFSIEWGEPL